MVDIVTGRVGVNEGVVAAVAVAVEHLGVVDIGDDGIWADESADHRVIESCTIVIQSGLRVQLLVGKLVVGDFGPGVLSHLPVGDVFRSPDLGTVCIGHGSGAAEVTVGYFIVKELKSVSRKGAIYDVDTDVFHTSLDRGDYRMSPSFPTYGWPPFVAHGVIKTSIIVARNSIGIITRT